MTTTSSKPTAKEREGKKPPGPKPVSENGFLPGQGWSRMRKTPFSIWLKLTRIRTPVDGKILTQVQLAELLGRSGTEVARWERGADYPPVSLIGRIAATFGVDPDGVWLKCYLLPPDIHIFLTTTVEGTQVLRNIRKIMDKLVAAQSPTMKPGVLPEDRPYVGNDSDKAVLSTEQSNNGRVNHIRYLADTRMVHDPNAFDTNGDPIDWEEAVEFVAARLAGFTVDSWDGNTRWLGMEQADRERHRKVARYALESGWEWERRKRTPTS